VHEQVRIDLLQQCACVFFQQIHSAGVREDRKHDEISVKKEFSFSYSPPQSDWMAMIFRSKVLSTRF
jgi:hypothetical protein